MRQKEWEKIWRYSIDGRIRQVKGKKKKEYYRKHKNEIQKKLRTKYDCACGGKYTCWHKSEHKITKRHKIFGGKAKGR